jgi:hypothetical protein
MLMDEIRMLRQELIESRQAMEDRTKNWLRLCGECNKELTDRFCPNCGHELTVTRPAAPPEGWPVPSRMLPGDLLP